MRLQCRLGAKPPAVSVLQGMGNLTFGSSAVLGMVVSHYLSDLGHTALNTLDEEGIAILTASPPTPGQMSDLMYQISSTVAAPSELEQATEDGAAGGELETPASLILEGGPPNWPYGRGCAAWGLGHPG